MKPGFYLFSLFFVLLSTGLSKAQNGFEKFKTTNQFKRLQWFSDRHSDPKVANIELARWDAYQVGKEQLLKSTSGVPTANWKSAGPVNFGGRMLCHAFDPVNSQIIWAGSASGGLWKTTNGGNSWNPITDQLPNLAVGAVAIHPQNRNIMLLGTGEEQIPLYYGGVTGNLRGNGIGVLRSVDGGLTWLPTNLTAPKSSTYFGTFGFAWDAVNPNKVCVATTYGIYASIDAGATWALKLAGIAMSIELNKSNPAVIYATLQNYGNSTGGIYRSTNSGQTWTRLINGLPASSNTGYADLTICAAFPNVLFTSIAGPIAATNFGQPVGVYKSSDGGNSWTFLTADTNLLCNPYTTGRCQGWYANTINVSPIDTNTLFMGGVVINKSTNGGLAWTQTNYDPGNPPGYFVHADHHDMAFDPANPTNIYSFCDGGVYLSSDNGVSWYTKNNGLVTFQFYAVASSFTNPDLIMGGSQDNGIHYSNISSSSGNWNKFISSDGFVPVIDYTNSNVWYQTDYPAVGWTKTTNGGLSGSIIMNGITEAPDFYMPLVMDPKNPQILYTASSAKIYKTGNGGGLWSPVATISDIDILAVDRINTAVIYGCTKKDYYNPNSVIYRSVDAGANWTQINSPGNVVTDIECDPKTSGIIYATRSLYTPASQVWKSVDFGNTWTNISTGFPGIPANTIAINPANTAHIYAGTDLGVYLSIDGGKNWAQFNDSLPNVMIADLHYSAPDKTLRAGTYGRGFWITKAADANLTSVHEENNFFSGIEIYPNPLIAHSSITYSLRESGNVNIKVCNYLGQEVNELFNGHQSSGKYTIDWDGKNMNAADVANGIYYIRFVVNNMATVKKIMVGK